MVTELEKKLSCLLRSVLADLSTDELIPDGEDFQDLLSHLSRFVPEVLSEIHPEWRFGGIDDLYSVESCKTGEGEAAIFGLCCYVTDQTLTPIFIHLQNSDSSDEITWFVCKQGEQRRPYAEFSAMFQHCKSLLRQEWDISWNYQVTYGERRE